MSIEAMKQALEALEEINKLSIGEGAICLPAEIDTAMDALRQAIEQAEKQEPVALEAVYETIIDWDEGGGKRSRRELAQRIVALYTTPQPQRDTWKNAAIRLGEELSSVGPDGYYNMTAEKWLDWAMDQQPRGKNSLSQPQREWVGLTDEEVDALEKKSKNPLHAVILTEAKLKEKNT